MPYALFLASCSMGSPMFLLLFLDLTLPSLRLLSCSASLLEGFSLYLFRVFPIELWDSLSVYVHPGIACLVFQASDWLGVFWDSLSGFCSSMTLVKLIMIGHCL